jgi:uncharacterized protein (TIGR04255 family)
VNPYVALQSGSSSRVFMAKPNRLPKAPIAEVVFELRWALQSDPGLPAFLHSDPGFAPLLNAFTEAMKKAGFGVTRDMSHPSQTGAYGVARRFTTGADKPFPIMQIGPGIFATNESSLYDWSSFRAQVIQGVRSVLKCYPKLKSFPLKPNYLELRYVDVFDKTLLGRTDLFYFAKHGTTLNIELPTMLNDRKLFGGEADGRFVFRRHLRNRKDTEFIMDFGSGKNKATGENIARLESKIVSRGEGVPGLKSNPTFLRDVSKWLKQAHEITSPFFKQFVTDKVMEQFKKV